MVVFLCISDRATRVDKVFVQPPWDTSEAAVEPIEEYNTTLFIQQDYDKHNSGFSMHILYSNYILKIKTFKPSSVAMKELVPLVVTFATKISRLEWLADITCFLLSIPCLERDRVSKTDGDQWSISFPKTKTMRLKIGSWKMFFVVTLLCVFFFRCYVSFFVGVLLKDQQGLFWISTQEYLSWGYQFHSISRSSVVCIPVWLWKAPKINVQDIHRHLSQYRMRMFPCGWWHNFRRLVPALLL